MENTRKILETNKSDLRKVKLACTEEIKKNVQVSQAEKDQKMIQDLLQNHYPLSAPEEQRLSDEINREQEINQVLKWTQKLNQKFDQHEEGFWPKLTEMRVVMDKKIQKAHQAVTEADNALREAIMAERIAKGQSLIIPKVEPRSQRVRKMQ